MSNQENVQAYQAIHQVLSTYIEGCIKADSSIMKPAFSTSATIFNADSDGQLVGGTIQTLFDAVDNDLQPSTNPDAIISRIDIQGTAASARIDAHNISGIGLTDYINLLNVEGKWVIINKVFQLHL